jgi:hypothetical protein
VQKASHGIGLVCCLVGRVVRDGGCDSHAEHFREAKREQQADEDIKEDLCARSLDRLVAGVVAGIGCPASRKAKDRCCEGQDRASLAFTTAHGDVDKVAAMSELAEHDEEDDEAGDPRDHFVEVNDLVAKKGDQEGACCNDDDPGVSRHVRVDGVDELCADNDVDGRPSQAGEAVEDGN